MNRTYLRALIVIGLCFIQSLSGMDGKSLREYAAWELPKISGENTKTVPGLSYSTTIYQDKKFIEALSELIGPHKADLDSIPSNFDGVAKSVKIEKGHWHVAQQVTTSLSTGNVCECVTIVIQSNDPNVVGMYHYFQPDDEDFKKLYAFLDEVKAIATRLSSAIPDFKVSIISSYISINFLIIKRILEANKFVIDLQHAPSYVWLADNLLVQPEDCTIKVGLLIVAGHSDLKIYQDPDAGKHDCYVM